MKIEHGEAKCSLCSRITNSWVLVPIVKSLKRTPKIKYVCVYCLNHKDFYYLSDYNVVKYNKITKFNEGSITKGLV